MGETTIGWTAVQDADGRWVPGYTFNPWSGCVEVSIECRGCFAREIDGRFHGGAHWGKRATRAMQREEYWAEPHAWNRRAARLGLRLRVFCGSMCDWLENRPELVPVRQRLLELIATTPHLDWLLLTKRPENLLALTPWRTMAPGNVWLGISAANQEFLDQRLPLVRQVGAVVTFVSAEPLLGPIEPCVGIDWLIIGSERGHGARAPRDEWRDAAIRAAVRMRVPVYLKQWQRPGARAGAVVDLPTYRGRQWLQQPRAAGWQPPALLRRRRCSATGCDQAVEQKLFMCPRHWRMVPKQLQAAIWDHYRPGQEKDGRVTPAYWAAAQAAIRAVAKRGADGHAQLSLFEGKSK